MFGKTIAKIRKSKNMTLKEVAAEDLSIAQLSRFENEKSMIPVNVFFEVLNNLNTSTEEFNYIKGQDKQNEPFKIFNQIEEYNNSKQFDKLEELKKEIQKSSPTPYSWEQFSVYFIESILNIHNGKKFSAEKPVLDYLMQVEDWGEMELRIYALFGFIFDIETTYHLMRTALKRSKQYQVVPASAKLLFVILSNNFSTFLNVNRLDYAEETIQLFEENYAKNTDFLSPHIDFMFNKGLLHFKKNQPDLAKEYCDNAIKICQMFHQTDFEKMYTGRYETWKTNYKDPKFHELVIQAGFFETETN